MENTAKNFALQLGSLVSLYVSIGALISLLFGIITVTFPDVAQGYWESESATSSIRFSIALLVVFFPTYIILTRLVNSIRRTEHGVYLTLTKWLIYISLLIGGAILLGDLVFVLNSFLNGELTTRFILKALSFFIVVGAGFVYYLFDARGYWQTHEKNSIQYGAGATFLVIASLVVGFMNIEGPANVREMKIDATQIYDLQNIQSRIEEAYRINDALPESVGSLFLGIEAPQASPERSPYMYTVTSPTTFELCAKFAYPSNKAEQMQYAQPVTQEGMILKNPYNWDHGAGVWCFKRVINVQDVTLNPMQKLK